MGGRLSMAVNQDAIAPSVASPFAAATLLNALDLAYRFVQPRGTS